MAVEWKENDGAWYCSANGVTFRITAYGYEQAAHAEVHFAGPEGWRWLKFERVERGFKYRGVFHWVWTQSRQDALDAVIQKAKAHVEFLIGLPFTIAPSAGIKS